MNLFPEIIRPKLETPDEDHIREVAKQACKKFDIKMCDLKSKKRAMIYVKARRWMFAQLNNKVPQNKIATFLNRERTTLYNYYG